MAESETPEPEQKTTEIRLGQFKVQPGSERVSRFSGILWGTAGCGKTTLACTAPGKKLLVNLDPDGPASLGSVPKDELVIVDLSAARPATVIEQMKQENPMRLKQFIEEQKIDSVILDSITMLGEMATVHAVSQLKGATLERPSLQGYGYRNAYVIQVVREFLRATHSMNTHMIFVAHEDMPEKNDQGIVTQVTIMIGGKMSESVPLRVSEVWYMSDTGSQRKIAIRPVRSRKPVKSRMFRTTGGAEFTWKFDADRWEGPGRIDTWWERWVQSGFEKISIPK